MSRFVHCRKRAIYVPQPSDTGMQLEPLKGHAVLGQQLGRRETHRSGPDQGELFTCTCHIFLPYCF